LAKSTHRTQLVTVTEGTSGSGGGGESLACDYLGHRVGASAFGDLLPQAAVQ